MAENHPTEEDPNFEDPDNVVTLGEVLQYENQMIEDTAAVLGAMNDKNCSYIEGYSKRQALYSCLTCIPEAKTDPSKRAGVCLACSYHCHDGHDLIELYTKRNFRCDCGNSKFGTIQCNLCPDKEPVNEENLYNQNFQGTYCVCSRPYPDPEDPVSDEMIQCVICEDWYHSRHLNAPVPSTPFVEMICFSCVGDHEFLSHYAGLSITEVREASVDEIKENIEVTSQKNDTPVAPSEGELEQPEAASNTRECKKPEKKCEAGTLFWIDTSWRNALCTCDNCLEMYGDENVLYLLDAEDPLPVYEEKGKAKAQGIIEDEDKKLLGSMDRVQLIETIAGYNELKESMAEFFRGFAENKRVIREEDVKEFFEEMQAKKRQRTEIPHFCR
ncbi:putative E3 ubiquitin-protein ligase UBR7 [Coccinella septempunctata]|uniref:putative E3 ubiquitin-protein ligase UBR7 n=1 Tax=Coccinella septempunctata TaxID=41139 RepID=UPI001D070773|nr:putative E3 ubiquitin-protein ligase UBR7 [Coccinella septempunctata]